MTDPLGPTLIVGSPGTGKTTEARRLALQDVAATGFPLLAIDPAHVNTLEDIHHEKTLLGTIKRVWGEGQHTAYTPETETEFDTLMQAARAGTRIVLLIDELSFYASSHYLSPALSLLGRLYRYALAHVYTTTQHFGDLSQQLVAVSARIIVFRTVSPRALERLEREFGLPPERVKALPQYHRFVVDLAHGGEFWEEGPDGKVVGVQSDNPPKFPAPRPADAAP